MSNIIDINNKSSVGSKMKELEARCATIELALTQLQSVFKRLNNGANFFEAVTFTGFKQLGIDLNSVAREINAQAQAEDKVAASPPVQSPAPESPAPEAPVSEAPPVT